MKFKIANIVVLSTLVTASGCFQSTAFRTGTAVTVAPPVQSPPPADGGNLGFNVISGTEMTLITPVVGWVGGTGGTGGTGGSAPPPTVPSREVQGATCRFKIRKNDAQSTVVKTFDLSDLSFNETEMVDTLRRTDEQSGAAGFSETYGHFFKMTAYQGAWGWASPGAILNPTFTGHRYYGATSGAVPGSSSPVHPDDQVPAIGSSQFIVEIQGGDAATCGFDFQFNGLKDLRKYNGSAYRDLRLNVGPWMLANESGDLKLPTCTGVSSSLGATAGAGLCQNGIHRSARGLESYTLMRNTGAQGNRFLVVLGGNVTADDLRIRVWGYLPGFLFGARWNPTTTNSGTRCDILINSTSDAYTAGTNNATFAGFPIGKNYKEMCRYSSWFWDTQH